MDALDEANRVRLKRAELKRSVRSGATDVTDVLRNPPDFAQRMPIGQLLRAQHRWGRKRALKILMLEGVSELRWLENIPTRQREALARRIEERRV